MYDLQEAHPRLWAARHVAVKVAGIVAAVLGIGAVLRALLPRLDVGLPETGWLKYVVGLLIAINVARAEVNRRTERTRREADARAREGAGD